MNANCIRAVFIAASLIAHSSPGATVPNGGFEDGFKGWRPLWTRDAMAGSHALDQKVFHNGRAAARIEHHGANDWSLEPLDTLTVKEGDIVELEAWLRAGDQPGNATLCAILYDANSKALDWSYGERRLVRKSGWQQLKSRIVVPAGVAKLHPRIIGTGPLTVWVDDFAAEPKGNVDQLRPAYLAAQLSVSNTALTVSFDVRKASLLVLDRRTRKRTEQLTDASRVIVTTAHATASRLNLQLMDAESGQEFETVIQMDPTAPEFTVELKGKGTWPTSLHFPGPFASEPGQYLVVPMNEGISYPVEDRSIQPFSLVAYGGHGICMAFWGVTDGDTGHMAILETPDDAAINILRPKDLLVIRPEWQAQRGEFGETRRLRYVFLEQGGHVAIAKRYRAYAQQTGLLKTLAEKRQFNPNVDQLIGAVNTWCWDKDSVAIVKDMQASGISRILWSNRQSPEDLKALNALNVLTSRYDIYQDVMNPENFPKLQYIHSDWTTAAWPKDIVIDAAGNWLHGWGVKGKDGEWYDCGVLCDKRAPAYAMARISEELRTHPYHSRFIDTTTAAPWHECYSPDHPMTRGDSREWKMKLLDQISRTHKLVTGSETGHDASVPFVHYFEGMMSLGPYRVPDAGRDMARVWTNAPERVVKFQLGHNYRLPLWELVYHDCVVAQWYWGDYNNKLPMLWDKRDLFNLLYATPPMFMFNKRQWQENKTRFVQSYRTTCPTVRRVGYSEMTDHRFLTKDRSVQQTKFANGVTVTVNFGPQPFKPATDASIPAMGSRVEPVK